MTNFTSSKTFRAVVSVSMLAVLAACGGGGGDSRPAINISGTAATGAPLPSAAISFGCSLSTANNFTATSDGVGRFSVTGVASFPCFGTATGASGTPTYKGLAAGPNSDGVSVMNFTPLTDLLVEIIMASIADEYSRTVTLADLLNFGRTSTVFAQQLPGKMAAYRTAVVDAIVTAMIKAGSPLTADEIAVLRGGFENTTFLADSTSTLDKILDKVGDKVLDNATLKSGLLSDVRGKGAAITPPPITGGGTGGTGGTGGSGSN